MKIVAKLVTATDLMDSYSRKSIKIGRQFTKKELNSSESLTILIANLKVHLKKLDKQVDTELRSKRIQVESAYESFRDKFMVASIEDNNVVEYSKSGVTVKDMRLEMKVGRWTNIVLPNIMDTRFEAILMGVLADACRLWDGYNVLLSPYVTGKGIMKGDNTPVNYYLTKTLVFNEKTSFKEILDRIREGYHNTPRLLLHQM